MLVPECQAACHKRVCPSAELALTALAFCHLSVCGWHPPRCSSLETALLTESIQRSPYPWTDFRVIIFSFKVFLYDYKGNVYFGKCSNIERPKQENKCTWNPTSSNILFKNIKPLLVLRSYLRVCVVCVYTHMYFNMFQGNI